MLVIRQSRCRSIYFSFDLLPLITRGQDSPVYWIGSWVGPRTGLEVSEKRKTSCLCRGLNPDFSDVQPIANSPLTVLRVSIQDDGLCADSHDNIIGSQQVESLPSLGAIEILRKWVLVSSYLSVCTSVRPYVRMEQLDCHWTNFYEIWYLCIFRKSVEKIQV